MKQLENIDSSGLGGLIAVQTKLQKVNGVLKVIEPSEKTRSVLKLTNLESYFNMNEVLFHKLISRICAVAKFIYYSVNGLCQGWIKMYF